MKNAVSGLTPKQELFCQEYAITLNATQAALKAGYGGKKHAPKTAAVWGCRLLQESIISDRVRELIGLRFKRVEVEGDRLVREVYALALSDIMEIVEIGEKNTARVLPKKEIKRKHGRQVQKITIAPGEFGDLIKIEMHNKAPAMAILMKHLGIADGSKKPKGAATGLVSERVLELLERFKGDKPK